MSQYTTKQPISSSALNVRCINISPGTVSARSAAQNVHIKDPAKRLNTKHFAYARECPIQATCLAEAHQRRTYSPQYHTPVIRPGNIQPGAISPNDPTPAEAANTERSPRAPARIATTRQSANSSSKSAAAAQKRVAE
ncbi:hypothetical protein TSTA_060490 [Talaromyces stipitatus ATCC 10500]|uniref:Uncharacterized protein n=1 Tax=Talaromyces stipitatus (strain ATCC 10500 / CBS 375.48 / QM 6759 / NRRL 1006) TaxID=441959 RepID=B8LU84_TALSN|nr:uncharacterized protein TSTA_060490 [Talaromyces stipitatus ATCC 10500]EED22556.1 hypothetical protein TSTA_060490 [Talaromyces stipitatus ATCC 10500]